jgi:hypothetical protein
MGRRDDAMAILGQVTSIEKRRYINAPFLAWIHAALGDTQEAFRRLEQGYQDRAWPMVYLKVEPKYDLLRKDARFSRLLTTVGF